MTPKRVLKAKTCIVSARVVHCRKNNVDRLQMKLMALTAQTHGFRVSGCAPMLFAWRYNTVSEVLLGAASDHILTLERAFDI